MNVFNYSPDTLEYVGSTLADVDPLMPGCFLIPANSTTIAPPDAPEGHTSVFVNGSWELAEDWRGSVGFVNGIPTTIFELGPLPEGWTTEAPRKEYTRQEAVDKIQNLKSQKRDSGFMLDGILWDSDSSARVAYTELAIKFINNPNFSTQWKASSGVWVTMTKDVFAGVQSAGESHISASFAWQAQQEAILATLSDEQITDFVENLHV